MIKGEWTGGECEGAHCVEVMLLTSGVKVRNSRTPDGPWLDFTAEEWGTFTQAVKEGKFDS